MKDRSMSNLKFAVHPGRILLEEYLEPMGLSAGALAKHLLLPRTRIERLVKEETSMTVDTAVRLSAALGTTPAFWMNLQTAYDLIDAESKITKTIDPLPMVV